MEQQYPGSHYQPLFDLMMNEHNLTLLHTELSDIIDVVRKMEQKPDKYILDEHFADNGEHSHWALIDRNTGVKVWEEGESGDNHEHAEIFNRYHSLKEKIGELGYNTFIHSKEVEEYRAWLRNDRYKHRLEWFEKEYPNGLYYKEDGTEYGVSLMTKKFLAEADAAYELSPAKVEQNATKEEILDSIVRDWSAPITRQDAYEAMEQYARLGSNKPVDGPWKVVTHHEAGVSESGCSGDNYITITDGKVSLYFDGGIDDDEQRLCNLLNQLKIKLDYDHAAELLCSQLEQLNKEYGEEITRLRGQEGLRWVKILSDADLPRDDSKEYVVKYEGGYDFKTVDGIKQLASQYVTFYLDESTSYASTKEVEIAFENWICNEEYYYRDKEGLWCMHGMSAGGKTTADLHALYQQSLNNKQPG